MFELDEYGRLDIKATRSLFDVQMLQFKKANNKGLLKTVKMMCQFLVVLAKMESNGIYIDTDALNQVEKDFEKEKSKQAEKNRQKQERNWAFFSRDNDIYALYWINSLKILRLTDKDGACWEFEDYSSEETLNNKLPSDLTIGTQLSELEGKYYFIAHKKIIFLRKKIYLGKFCQFDFDQKKIIPGNYWLVHSLKSMFGAKNKTNPHLLSCTYFSGIQASHDSLELAYGVNDLDFGFSTHKYEEL